MKVNVNKALLKQRMLLEDRNTLFKALKSDDPKGAKKAIVGMNGEDLNITHDEFRKLTKFIDDADAGAVNKDPMMNGARQILGIGKNVPQSQTTTQTHNPVTGQPWTSGPAQPKKSGGRKVQLNKQEVQALDFLFNSNNKRAARVLKTVVDDYEIPEDSIEHLAMSLHYGLEDMDDASSNSLTISDEGHEDLDSLAISIEEAMAAGVLPTQYERQVEQIRKKLIRLGVYADLGFDVDPDLR